MEVVQLGFYCELAWSWSWTSGVYKIPWPSKIWPYLLLRDGTVSWS